MRIGATLPLLFAWLLGSGMLVASGREELAVTSTVAMAFGFAVFYVAARLTARRDSARPGDQDHRGALSIPVTNSQSEGASVITARPATNPSFRVGAVSAFLIITSSFGLGGLIWWLLDWPPWLGAVLGFSWGISWSLFYGRIARWWKQCALLVRR